MVNWIPVLCILVIGTVVKAQIDVDCFPGLGCVGSAIATIEEDCCRHGVAPFGLSFSLPGNEGCVPCPVEFGFVEPTFTATERVEAYDEVRLAFMSGLGALGAFRLSITYTAGTATEDTDVQITSPEIIIPSVVEQAELQTAAVEMIFRLDGIAQEANETFTLGFTVDPGALGPNPTLRDSMQGTVLDANRVTFQLSEADYREPEGENAEMPVIISKASDVFIANPVEFMIIPLTVDQALAQGVIPSFEPNNPFSPNRADFNDFDNSTIPALFLADEGQNPRTDLDTPVPIFDDDVDEADDQSFIAYLVVVNAMNRNLIDIDRSASACIIVDNDPIQIGFEMEQYDFTEPELTLMLFDSVRLIREDNRESEQTFGVEIRVSDPGTRASPATLQQPGQVDGFDYVLSTPGTDSITLTFPPDQSTVNFTFSLFPDLVVEGTEGFEASISSAGPPFPTFQLPVPTANPPPVPPAFPTALITIQDNDVITIGFNPETYTVNEADGSITLNVEILSGTLERSVTVLFQTSPGTATEADYAGVVQTLTFNASMLTNDVPVTILNDNIMEGNETFFAMLSSQGQPVITSPDNATVLILGESVQVVIGLEETLVTVSEDVGNRELCASVMSGTLQRNVEVDVVYQDRNAINGEDFIADPTTLTFTPEVMTVCFNATVIDDARHELNEDFFVNITTSDPQTDISPMSVIVTIQDDDVLVIGWERLMYNVSEAEGSVEICAIVREGIQAVSLPPVTVTTTEGTAMAASDYEPITNPRTFNFKPDQLTRMCTIVTIQMDGIVENLLENFFAGLGIIRRERVTLEPDRTQINILDSDDRDNMQPLVNDTIIGDPLFTVPILVPEEQLQALNLTSLSMCYEIHGSSDQWFNLVTDECTSVNSRYTALNEHLNIIDEIGVRAVDNAGRCVNILVDLDRCRAEINDHTLDSRYSRDGISVRRYTNRVRISVPNCNDLTLVMWVICQQRTLEDPFQPGMFVTEDMIKFVVMRGLNFGHRPAHGLLGQYWNIPVDVTPYTGQLRSGMPAPPGIFVLNLTTFGSAPRSFTGWLFDLTWEFEKGPCLYVGDRQGGPIYEIRSPNDRVTAELYSDYQVNNAFSEENYDFGLFSEERCMLEGSGDAPGTTMAPITTRPDPTIGVPPTTERPA